MNPLQYNPALMMRGGGGEVRAEKKVVFVKLSDQVCMHEIETLPVPRISRLLSLSLSLLRISLSR